jgi:hypothetical protein
MSTLTYRGNKYEKRGFSNELVRAQYALQELQKEKEALKVLLSKTH